jgi:putative transposase
MAHGEQKARALLAEGLRMAELSDDDLAGFRCTEPRKVLLAALLWKKTTVSKAWIAEHLCMKNAANVSRVVHRMDQARLLKKVSKEMRWFIDGEMKENAH